VRAYCNPWFFYVREKPLKVNDFLIFLMFEAKCSSGCIGSSCGGVLFNSYQNLMQNAHMAALPPPVVIPSSTLIQN
jgi:hypothetical protein